MYVTIPSDTIVQKPFKMMTGATARPPKAQLKAGSYVYFEGDRVDWLYQVTSGVLRLTRLLQNGRRQVIAFGYPGDIVGFPSDGHHHTDCDVLVEARLQPYRICMLEQGEGDPELHRNLLQAALREISAMQDHFLMLGRKSAIEKVASFISVLADRVGDERDGFKQVNLPMSRCDIADFLGLTTETVSRTLTQLRKDQIIAIENNHTIILLRPTDLLERSVVDCA
jgi:CRP/FNR family transcriptional regulator